MTIREKEHLFPAIETISEWCKGHECGEGCEFYIDHYNDEEGYYFKDCLFGSCPSAWIKELKELEQLDSSDIEAAYQRGLEEAWEGARKLLFDSSLSRDILTDLGADSFCGIIHDCSADEAIVKLKEYEEQQKQSEKSCKNCKHGINGMLNFKSGRCEACYYDERIGGNCLFEEKQTEEKTDKSCESCRFADLQEYEFPCSVCSASHTFRWEARKGAEES